VEGNGIDVEGLHCLASASNMACLTHLDLSRNPAGFRGVQALTRSPYLGRLTTLKLGGTGLDDKSLKLLLVSPLFRHLLDLDLRGNRRTETVAEILASTTLAPQTTLWLDASTPEQEWLRQHFGEQVQFG